MGIVYRFSWKSRETDIRILGQYQTRLQGGKTYRQIAIKKLKHLKVRRILTCLMVIELID